MQASLAREEDLQYLSADNDEDRMLRLVIETALRHPQSNPAALLHQMEKALDARLLGEIQRELHHLDENLDFALEFEGARKQLREMYFQRKHARLLDSVREKSLSQLTPEERELLKTLNSR